jgi:nicotinate-nucleotide adenylyltransferase
MGVYGGSFNPIHLGHLSVAEEIRKRHGLEKVVFVPAAQSPFKGSQYLAANHLRLEMVRLAIATNRSFEVSDCELVRGGKSFTIDTLRHFHDFWGKGTEILFILGADAVKSIASWKDIHEALSLCRFIVATRPGYDSRPSLSGIEQGLRDNILFEDGIQQDISSSEIRRRVRANQSIRDLVPEPVEKYIAECDLYR